jgi:hypothetical protein
MSRLRLTITMSLDGFVAGTDQSEHHPLGVGGEQLHQWLLSLKTFCETYGEKGGEVKASTPIAEERELARPSWAGTCSVAGPDHGKTSRGTGTGEVQAIEAPG